MYTLYKFKYKTRDCLTCIFVLD